MIGSVISEVNCNRCRSAPVDAMIYMFATIDKNQFAKTHRHIKVSTSTKFISDMLETNDEIESAKEEIFRRYVSLVGGLIPPLCRIS